MKCEILKDRMSVDSWHGIPLMPVPSNLGISVVGMTKDLGLA